MTSAYEADQYISDVEAANAPLEEVADRTTLEKVTTIFSTAAGKFKILFVDLNRDI